MAEAGTVVILNGAPRSGKSSIVAEIQQSFDGLWINLGVDTYFRATPKRYWPGIGLRPGGEGPGLEPLIQRMYAALYESIAAHSRLGINVVAEFGHHDWYSKALGILPDCARRLAGLPVLFVGVRCPIAVIMARRNAGQTANPVNYERSTKEEPVPPSVQRFEDAVHVPGTYDLEVDTSKVTPAEAAELIRQQLAAGIPSPSAFQRIAAGQS